MRIRLLIPFVAVAAIGCAAETADQAAATEEPQEYAASADAASLAAFVADWQTHYNMGHGSMVADYFSDDGLMWSGNAGMSFGKEAIAASLQGGIDMASPQITIDLTDQIIRGNFAVSYGTYASEGTIDGVASGNSGGWMSYAEMIDGEWKLHGLVSNIGDGQSAPGFQHTELPAAHESAAMAAEGAAFFATHFNMGHAGMVAERYAEDAINIGGPENGRAAVQANLQGLIDQGAQVSLTPFAAAELGDDYITSIGTFELTVAGATQSGHYGNVQRKGDDGSLTTVWSVVSTHPGM